MRIIGYLSSLLGVLVLVSSRIPKLGERVSSILKFIPKESFSKYSLYLGFGLIILGLFMLFVSLKKGPRTSAGREVPIYSGNQIVGYRRN